MIKVGLDARVYGKRRGALAKKFLREHRRHGAALQIRRAVPVKVERSVDRPVGGCRKYPSNMPKYRENIRQISL